METNIYKEMYKGVRSVLFYDCETWDHRKIRKGPFDRNVNLEKN